MSCARRSTRSAVSAAAAAELGNPGQERNWAIRIKEAGDTLLELVAGMVDFSQIENLGLQARVRPGGRAAGRSTRPSSVFANARPRRASAWSWKRLATVRTGATATRSGCGRPWSILPTNAIKYNRANGTVRFVLQSDAAAGQVRIEVHDTGVGLTEGQRAQLFQPFNRLGRESLQVPGAGIGLVVARQVVEAMGGRITVESERGRGSCFAIHLPIAPPV